MPATVSLRARTDDDLDLLYAIAADLDSWEERNPEPPRLVTREQFLERMSRRSDQEASGDLVSFVVEADGTAVGGASLFGFDRYAHHAEAGITLAASARGRGVGTAAILALVEFGFTRLNLRRIHLQAIASNTAALRAYANAGFVEEGRQREHAWVRGGYEDIVLMGILRPGG